MEQWSLAVTSAPATEPVTLDAAKSFLRVEHSADDTLISALIQAGRERCERVADRALITQTLRMSLPGWPCGRVIELRRPPLVSVTTVQYVDAATGTLTTLDAGDYEINADAQPATIQPAYDGDGWPAAQPGPRAVRITYIAGYGAATAVPAEIKQRILNYVAYCYEHPVERDEHWLDTLFQGFHCGAVA